MSLNLLDRYTGALFHQEAGGEIGQCSRRVLESAIKADRMKSDRPRGYRNWIRPSASFASVWAVKLNKLTMNNGDISTSNFRVSTRSNQDLGTTRGRLSEIYQNTTIPKQAIIDPAQYVIAVPEQTAISIYERVDGATRDRIDTSRWVRSLQSSVWPFFIKLNSICLSSEHPMRRINLICHSPRRWKVQRQQHRPHSTPKRSDLLGRYSRLAARKRDGRGQASSARHSLPFERIYVSFGSDLGTTSGGSQQFWVP
jgi:hypothetical protein